MATLWHKGYSRENAADSFSIHGFMKNLKTINFSDYSKMCQTSLDHNQRDCRVLIGQLAWLQVGLQHHLSSQI